MAISSIRNIVSVRYIENNSDYTPERGKVALTTQLVASNKRKAKADPLPRLAPSLSSGSFATPCWPAWPRGKLKKMTSVMHTPSCFAPLKTWGDQPKRTVPCATRMNSSRSPTSLAPDSPLGAPARTPAPSYSLSNAEPIRCFVTPSKCARAAISITWLESGKRVA